MLPMLKPMPGKALPVVVASIALLVVPAAASACENTGGSAGEISVEEAGAAMVCLINERRHKQGVKKLDTDSRLEVAAQAHSDSMNADNYFAHSSPGGGSPQSRIRASGYLAGADSWGIAENLRWGIGGKGTPRKAIRAWMASPGHRQVMLSGRYRDVGVGVAVGSPRGGGNNGMIYTADFGYRH